MATHRRTDAAVQGDVLGAAIAATLGREARTTRRRRRLTQQRLADAIEISRPRYSEIERGLGATAPLDTWVRVGAALGRPLVVQFSRDITAPDPCDAGHLAAQGARPAPGPRPRTDRQLRAADPPGGSCPIGRRRPARRRAAGQLILTEIWNRLDDLGAAARATDRKVAEAARGPALFAGAGAGAGAGADDEPYRVASCWLLVDTAANRRLVARYPEIIRARFPGSSVGWVRALAEGAPPPVEPGVAWIDPRSARLTAVGPGQSTRADARDREPRPPDDSPGGGAGARSIRRVRPL